MDRRSRTLCCVGFVLSSPGGPDEGHERQMNVERVVAADLLPELPDRFEEGQALDVADRAADFHQHDVDALRDRADGVLDFVRDVRNDLDRAPEVVAAPLLLDDALVDLPGRPVRILGRDRVREPFVVAQVEVGLGAIVGDVDLAVLVRAHRPRIDVDVRVEFLHRDSVAVAFEQTADGGGCQALAERRHHATGHEDVLGSSPVH